MSAPFRHVSAGSSLEACRPDVAAGDETSAVFLPQAEPKRNRALSRPLAANGETSFDTLSVDA